MKHYVLIKFSTPGWTKHFDTLQKATEELRKYICEGCLEGTSTYIVDDGKVVVERHVFVNPNSINDLLSTSCGAEFGFEWPE